MMNTQTVIRVLQKSIAWADAQNYTGYGKFDALNSPLLYKLSFENYYLYAGFTYMISRIPINLRPLLGVKKHQNRKALGLFARTYFNLYKFTHDKVWLKKGEALLELLLKLSLISNFSGHCWGNGHPRQSIKFYDDGNLPGAAITVEVAEAFLDSYLINNNQEQLEIAISAAKFITNDLVKIENKKELLCYSYIPKSTWKVINANAKTAAFLARLALIINDKELVSNAYANMNWVVNCQTDYGAWYYAEPPNESHVKHDNYHTGFVLSSLLQYMDVTGDFRWKENVYYKGLKFYDRHLFLSKGEPKWRSNRLYPFDIHGAAQGILNFALASKYYPSKIEQAQNIFKWVTENMLAYEGHFYYQKGRFFTKRYTLMRWCQAWMCYALSILANSFVDFEK